MQDDRRVQTVLGRMAEARGKRMSIPLIIVSVVEWVLFVYEIILAVRYFRGKRKEKDS